MPRIKKSIPFTLVINDNRRSVKTASIIESVVNQRFHFADGVNEAGAAKGKTDQHLELKVPRVYHHNQDRYFRVVRLLPIVNSPAPVPSGWRPGGRSYSTPRPRALPR